MTNPNDAMDSWRLPKLRALAEERASIRYSLNGVALNPLATVLAYRGRRLLDKYTLQIEPGVDIKVEDRITVAGREGEFVVTAVARNSVTIEPALR